MPSSISEPGDIQLVYLRRLTENKTEELLITFILCPFKTPVVFLADTSAQMSALRADVANRNGIVADKK